MADRKDVASAILACNYGELKAIGAELAGACADKECRPRLKTPEEFADLLFDWAEATK